MGGATEVDGGGGELLVPGLGTTDVVVTLLVTVTKVVGSIVSGACISQDFERT